MVAVRPHPVGGELRTDFGSLDHPTMKAMLDRGDPRTISAMASTWEATGSRISEQAAGLEGGLGTLRERWGGPAADAYIAKMDGLTATLRGTADACFRTRDALSAAAEALTAAKQQMPAPTAGDDGHPRAVAVMRQLSDRYLTAQAAIPGPPDYSGPQIPSAHGAGGQPAVAHTDGPAGAPGGAVPGTPPGGAVPGTPPGSAPPGGHVVLTSAVVPGHPVAVPGHAGATAAALASPAGASPPGAMPPGVPSGGGADALSGGGAGAAGVAGAATGAERGAAAGPAGGAAASGAAIPPGMPLFPAAGGVSGAAAATRPSGQGGSGVGGLFAEHRGSAASGLPPGGVIEAPPAGPAGARPADDIRKGPIPDHRPVTAPDGAIVAPQPPPDAGAQPAGTRRTTWLIESEDIWGTGPAAPAILGQS